MDSTRYLRECERTSLIAHAPPVRDEAILFAEKIIADGCALLVDEQIDETCLTQDRRRLDELLADFVGLGSETECERGTQLQVSV